MQNAEVEELLNEIGVMLAEDIEYSLDGTLLVAEVASNTTGLSIFKDRGDDILFRWPDARLGRLVLALWEEAEPDKRWAEMEYLVYDGTFHATFNYPEDIDPQEDEFARRDRIVKRHFGDRPIVYPPWHRGEDGIQFEL